MSFTDILSTDVPRGAGGYVTKGLALAPRRSPGVPGSFSDARVPLNPTRMNRMRSQNSESGDVTQVSQAPVR